MKTVDCGVQVQRISVDGGSNRRKKAAFLTFSRIVWAAPCFIVVLFWFSTFSSVVWTLPLEQGLSAF